MNGKKITSMIFKTLNYTNEIKKKSTNGHGGRRQLFKSLRHSLRIPASQPKKLEWFDEQSKLNLIWLPDTGTIKLDDFPKEKRESLLAKITDEAEAPTIDKSNRAELIALRAKLKNTVKNASKKETDEGSILAFQNILNVQGVADTEQLLSELGQFDIKRKGQKLDTARKFLDCHNEIERGPKPLIKKNQAVIQEAFFKFPARNEVKGISPEKRIELIKEFYQAAFPNYPIQFIVLHGDEDADLTEHSDHPHLFISTRNSKTGRYDLRETQIKLVNAYLHKFRPGTNYISEKPDYLESQLLFGYLQDMFYAQTNNKLLKNTLYRAQKHKKTQEHMSKLRYINGEARKPKSEREFSLYQLAKEKRDEALKNTDLAKKQALYARDYARKANESAKNAQERQRLAKQSTAEEHEQAAAYRRSSAMSQQTIAKNNAESIRIQAQIASQIAQLKLFKGNLSDLVEGVVNWIDECFSKRRQDIQDKFLEQARKAFERVSANDQTVDRIYTKNAEDEVDKQLKILDEYKDAFPDLPESEEVKRSIIRPFKHSW
ncbi:hypothetical protein [Pseudomonas capsici]|uniref:hypothetical protein n=1 Tax=Pseudomonas capsici TaxID=2810614 RepID=UPI00403A9734